MSALSEIAPTRKNSNLIPPPKSEAINIQGRKEFFATPVTERTREEYIRVLGMKEIRQKARQIIGNQPTMRKIFAKLTDPVKILMDYDLQAEQEKKKC